MDIYVVEKNVDCRQAAVVNGNVNFPGRIYVTLKGDSIGIANYNVSKNRGIVLKQIVEVVRGRGDQAVLVDLEIGVRNAVVAVIDTARVEADELADIGLLRAVSGRGISVFIIG